MVEYVTGSGAKEAGGRMGGRDGILSKQDSAEKMGGAMMTR